MREARARLAAAGASRAGLRATWATAPRPGFG